MIRTTHLDHIRQLRDHVARYRDLMMREYPDIDPTTGFMAELSHIIDGHDRTLRMHRYRAARVAKRMIEWAACRGIILAGMATRIIAVCGLGGGGRFLDGRAGEKMVFKPNRFFRRKYRRLYRKDPRGANLLLLMCELANYNGRVETNEEELARLFAVRFNDPHEYALKVYRR